jgi:hypothetical protein
MSLKRSLEVAEESYDDFEEELDSDIESDEEDDDDDDDFDAEEEDLGHVRKLMADERPPPSKKHCGSQQQTSKGDC